jgi:hypothetical protein
LLGLVASEKSDPTRRRVPIGSSQVLYVNRHGQIELIASPSRIVGRSSQSV